MPDNLAIQILVDTGKARADLELLNGKLRDLGKEMRVARDEAMKTGDRTNLDRLAKEYDGVSRSAKGLQTQLRATNTTIDKTSGVVDALATKSMRRLLTQFDNLSKTAQNVSMVVGGISGSFAGGFLAASIFKGIDALIQRLDAVSERIKKIRDQSRETGQAPLATQAAQEQALAVGEPAEAADKIMGGVGAAMAKAKTATTEATGAVNVFRGSMDSAGKEAANMGSQFKDGIAVFRGGSKLMRDFSDPLGVIGVKLNKFKGDAAGTLEATKAIAQGFLNMQKSLSPTQLNELSKALFQGLPADAAVKILPGLIKQIDADIAKLKTRASGVTGEAIVSQAEVDTAKEKVNKIFRDWEAAGQQWRNRMAVITNEWIADFIDVQLPKAGAAIATFFTETLPATWNELWTTLWQNFNKNAAEAYTQFTEAWKPLSEFFTTLFDGVMSAAGRALDWIIEKVRSVVSAVQSVKQQVTDPSKPYAIPPMASGGMIRGPGSGTSDSILARLSNGEFVMRAAAVNKWGPRFMAALNSMQNPFGYAGGGLVRQRFATGGMVTAKTSDGVTVNLTFPGGTFALRGDKEIVGGLTREARRAGMLSAGRLAAAIN